MEDQINETSQALATDFIAAQELAAASSAD